MKANELRIGNWVTYHGDEDMPCQLDATDIKNIAEGYMHSDELHSPIPLTPEVLEKCGFRKLDDNPFWGHPENDFYATGRDGESFPIAYNEERGYRKYFACDDDFYSFYGMRITSLHQLQNLYFALTGNELQYKP